MDRAKRLCFSSGGRDFSTDSGFERINKAPTPRCTHPVSIAQRGEGAWGPSGQPPSCLEPTAGALPRSLTATISPTWDWSPRDVSRYLLNACKVAAFGRDVLLSGSASPVLRRWLGLTPERPVLHLRGSPRRLRVALSRGCDPPGLGGRWGAQGAARGAVSKNDTIYPTQVCTRHTTPIPVL